MSAPSSNKNTVMRAAAICSQTVENNTAFVLNRAWNSEVSLHLQATIGSSTNLHFKYYVSSDDSTYYPIETVNGGVVLHSVTANTTKVVKIKAPGWTYLRVAVIVDGGSVTGSSATVTARYITRAV